MPINTDLNQAPYWDDFNEDKNFHRILFRPHLAVQARELTQLQTILQNQIERFGDNILREGTIVTGGNFREEAKLPYVKLQDADTNGGVVSVADYVGMYAYGTVSGLSAVIVAAEQGLESQAPDLNTIWVKYVNTQLDSAGNDKKVFDDGEDIEIRTSMDVGYSVIATPVAAVSSATGFGYGVRCGDGIIYQKGAFVKFSDSVTIVSKYDTAPDGVVVGFVTSEELIDSYIDESLLDNANSYNNYNAPGADRLKLVPTLVTKTIAEAQADQNFLALQEYSSGNVIRRKLDTVYSKLQDMLARRTLEESGNYTVRGLSLSVEESSLDNKLTAVVSPGVAYVQGRRVEYVGDVRVSIDQGTDTGQETGQNILTNFGNYVVVSNMRGVFDFERFESVSLENSGGVQIGSALVRSVMNHSANEHRIYLFNVEMNAAQNFADVRSLSSAAGGTADLVLVNGSARMQEANLRKAIFDTGRDYLAQFDATQTKYDYRAKQTVTMDTGGNIGITLTGTDEFPYGVTTFGQDQIEDFVVVAAAADGGSINVGDVIDIASGSSTQTTATITATSSPLIPIDVVVYYNAQRTSIQSTRKVLTNYSVTIDSTNVNAGNGGPFCLGFPDVLRINSATLNGVDVTSAFKLDSGQRDTFYGLSSAVGSVSLAGGDSLVFDIDVFEVPSTSVRSFFNIDSYPIDDSAVPAAATIKTYEIPNYTSESGTVYDLRDSVDFRPYVQETYTASGGLNPVDSISFASFNRYFPAPNSTMSASYTYYLGRYDLVSIDEAGSLNVLEGRADENPTVPPAPKNAMVLGTVYLPPFPSLSSSVANSVGKPKYGVRFTKKNNRRYTMSDIRQFDERIGRLEYYASLSALETKTKDQLVLDANGLDRFKNGIFVDSFQDFRIADINDTEFGASIDLVERCALPKFNSFPVTLKVSDNANTAVFGECATLAFDEVLSIEQPYASSEKNCTTSYYNFRGSIEMTPDFDTAPETTRAPNINFEIDLETPFVEFSEQLARFLPVQASNLVVSPNARNTTALSTAWGNSNQVTDTTETTSNPNAETVGDFVTDVRISPWIRPRLVRIFAHGLRPNTKFTPFFDQVDVSQHTAPAIFNTVATPSTAPSSTSVRASQVVQSGQFGDEIRSDANGELYCVFLIPEQTFRTGDRLFELADVINYASMDATTSYASKSYSAFSLNVQRTAMTATTRLPEISTDVPPPPPPAPARPVPAADTSSREQWLMWQGDPPDPLIQSFIFDGNVSEDSVTFLTKVDLFFSSKHEYHGCTVSIVEMENGVPTQKNIPFSKVHLKPADIQTSNDGSVRTTVVFDAPVAVRTNAEYGLKIMPDASAPDYKVWISRIGEVDLLTGVRTTHDTNGGMIFTSTNGRTWTPYQNENLKFNLYIADFNTNSGYVTFEPNDVEFLDVDTPTTPFIPGEYLYVEKANNTGTIGIQTANSTITGSGTLFTADLVSGDYIVADVAGTPQVMQVTENGVDSDTQIRMVDVPQVSATGVSWYKTVVGRVSSTLTVDQYKIILEESSAKTGNVFAVGDTVVGMQSGARTTITDLFAQPVSYIQPNIARLDFIGTRSKMTGNFVDSSFAVRSIPLDYNGNNFLKQTQLTIPSKSMVVLGAPSASFDVSLETLFGAASQRSSPFIDYDASSLILYEYIVNDDLTDEDLARGGLADSKYISKLVELAPGMDAEDIKVFVDGYRPAGTDLKAYVRLVSATDSRPANQVGWTPMVVSAESNYYSSAANRSDFREFEFNLPLTGAGTDFAVADGSGNFQYTGSDGVVHDSFKYFAIKIVMTSQYKSVVPRIRNLRAIACT